MFEQIAGIKMRGYWYGVCLMLCACSSAPVVPVDERRVITVPEQTEKIGGSLVRVVQPGDTIYSIAFAAGISVSDLAAWNSINNNYQIRVGQKLRLTRPQGFVPRYTVVDTAPAISSQASSGKKNNNANPTANRTTQTVINEMSPKWGWPTKGKIIRNFYPSVGRKGIDILGNKGQSIVAASSGQVVYVGNGLRGYGNLIIIKHSQNFLSAYANNKNILISQGDYVNRGTRIAEMGRNESGQYALHFQIRKNGKPVNPKPFLLTK